MDFGAFPPEVNSGRMYAGPGSTPMLAAASAWDAVAAELGSAASAYGSAINSLTEGPWLGPASAAMVVAVSPYLRWMSTTATEAELTADQARAAAAAYEAAFAATVPPMVVAENRLQLAALLATNVVGQNTAAIAANEALYGEMWAQDASAMYGYAGSSSAAATVTPFKSAPEITNAAGAASQGSAVSQAAGTSSSAGAQSALSQVVSTVPTSLQSLATPVQSATPSSILTDIGTPLGLQPGDITNLVSNLASSSFTPMSVAGITQVGADLSVIHALNAAAPAAGASGVAGEGVAAMGAVAPAPASLASAPISAGIGRATLVGTMSVPQSWAAAIPAANHTVGSLPAAAEGWAIPPGAGMAETAPMAGAPGIPGVPGGGLANRGYGFAAPRYGFKPSVVTRPPAAG